MFQFLKYLLHKQIIEMCHSQNLRRPLSVPCPTQCHAMYLLDIRWLLRFEFQLPHPILSPALATDKKWPLSQFHISYQNSEISWPKAPISDFQSQFSMSKIIRIFLNFFFIEEYQFRGMFFVIDIFWKLQFLKHFVY